MKRTIMSEFTLSSKYIAPWALATEGLPIHLMWNESLKYDKIEIVLPSEIMIKDFFNVDVYNSKDNRIEILKLKSANYFGFLVSTVNKIFDVHIQRNIHVNFYQNDEIIFSETFEANIFRPVLKLLEPPKEFILSEDKGKNQIDINLELSGFGHIQVKADVSSGGKFRTKLEPLYQVLLEQIITTFDSDLESDVDEKITINPEFIEDKADEFIKWVKEGRLPIAFNEKDLLAFKSWLYDEKNYDKVIKILSKHMNALLVNSLVHYLERNPEDNITMLRGEPSVLIDELIHTITVRLTYKDSMDNEYDPVLAEIKISDIRKEKVQINIPINFDWTINIINPMDYCESVE